MGIEVFAISEQVSLIGTRRREGESGTDIVYSMLW